MQVREATSLLLNAENDLRSAQHHVKSVRKLVEAVDLAGAWDEIVKLDKFGPVAEFIQSLSLVGLDADKACRTFRGVIMAGSDDDEMPLVIIPDDGDEDAAFNAIIEQLRDGGDATAEEAHTCSKCGVAAFVCQMDDHTWRCIEHMFDNDEES